MLALENDKKQDSIMQINNLLDYIKFPFRKEKDLYKSFYRIFGFFPRNLEPYKQALVHKSIGRRNEKGRPINNERLEFLGDAVLDAVVGDIVFSHFKGKREGFLTNTRSKIVQRETLNRLAQEMGINQLILSNGHNSTHNNYMGGNAFEALVGAVYLDRGYNACMKFMRKRILKELINLDKVAYKEVNFKSRLIEWTQKNRVKIEFIELSEVKEKGGSPKFSYKVRLEEIDGEQGCGYSKKESQQIASKLTLQRLRREPQFIDAVFNSKADRTKMEEHPIESVPCCEEDSSFTRKSRSQQVTPQKRPQINNAGQQVLNQQLIDSTADISTEEEYDLSGINHLPQDSIATPSDNDEYDLSDTTIISHDQAREDIIAAAEEAAFSSASDD